MSDKILLTGGTGFLGSHLGRKLTGLGYRLVVLTRDVHHAELSFPAELIEWDGKTPPNLANHSDVSAVFHLAGMGIADKRWTERRKKELWNSRVLSTETLLRARFENLKLFVCASGVGFYGDCGTEVVDESSPQGRGFLSELCGAWERAAMSARDLPGSPRVVISRLGVVLSPHEGFLGRLESIFRLGLGGRLGDGRQMLSWVHVEDLMRFFGLVLSDRRFEGVYNLTSPHPVSNAELTRVLSKVFVRPAFFHAPAWVLKAGLGSLAEVLLEGQKALPRRLLHQGFDFRYPDLELALRQMYADLKR